MKSLSSNPSIIITHVDKEWATVILNKVDYINKALELLQDESTYILIKKDIISSIQIKLNSMLTKY